MEREDRWDVDDYQRYSRSLPRAGHALLKLLDAQEGEKILDVGCGDGFITEKICSVDCTVVGIDISPEMIKASRARHIDARLMDARYLTFNNEFDAVFSHAALHWIKEQDMVVRGIAKALKKGGRFIAECGGGGNVTIIATGLIKAITDAGYGENISCPWYYYDHDTYRAILERHGLSVEFIKLVPRLAPLPNGMRAWLKLFATSFLAHVPPAKHPSILDEAENFMRPFLCNKEGLWHADYVRLWIMARKR